MNKVLINKIQYAFYSPLVWILLFLKGVKNIKKSYWNGFPYISRAPGSSIVIHPNCRFASRHTSNVLGINHKCMLTTVSPGSSIVIGEGCSFSGTSISSAASIVLKKDVRCGANTMIMDTDGHWDDYRAEPNKPIVIEDNVWLGVGVIVMKGSIIGRNALIGAGTIVRGVIPPYSIVVGNPAKVVGFSMPPEEAQKYEEKQYPADERTPIELLNKNYDKYFISRIKDIKHFTKL